MSGIGERTDERVGRVGIQSAPTTRVSISLAWMAALAVVVVVGLTALFLIVPVRSQEPVYDGIHRTLSDVRYGWPFDSISQDQRSANPPAGSTQSFCDVRQCPVRILPAGLLGDVLVLWIGLAIVALPLVGVARTARRRPT